MYVGKIWLNLKPWFEVASSRKFPAVLGVLLSKSVNSMRPTCLSSIAISSCTGHRQQVITMAWIDSQITGTMAQISKSDGDTHEYGAHGFRHKVWKNFNLAHVQSQVTPGEVLGRVIIWPLNNRFKKGGALIHITGLRLRALEGHKTKSYEHQNRVNTQRSSPWWRLMELTSSWSCRDPETERKLIQSRIRVS
jgi:hypothetical protein